MSEANISTSAEAIKAELKIGWALFLLRGITAILVGILLISQPARTLVAFTNVVALFLLIDGIFMLVSSLLGRNGWSLIGAILSIIIAIFVLGHPVMITLIAATTLLLIIGISSLTSGIVNLFGTWQHRDGIDNWLWIALNAVMSILFGLLILFGNTLFAGIVLLQVAGIYLIVMGIALIVLAFRFRSLP